MQNTIALSAWKAFKIMLNFIIVNNSLWIILGDEKAFVNANHSQPPSLKLSKCNFISFDVTRFLLIDELIIRMCIHPPLLVSFAPVCWNPALLFLINSKKFFHPLPLILGMINPILLPLFNHLLILTRTQNPLDSTSTHKQNSLSLCFLKNTSLLFQRIT